ncbi:hypothetical protein ACFY3N_11470 [Streptomyces sp. NPDC000348]|uniref:hypothetical protein n=1 Tax=Streptomyces sp. NPDC000348 TaxID=3364538 RepID=UPI0036B19C95
MSDTALGRGQGDDTPATAFPHGCRVRRHGRPGSGCGGTPGVGASASRPATRTGDTLPPSTCTLHGTARG